MDHFELIISEMFSRMCSGHGDLWKDSFLHRLGGQTVFEDWIVEMPFVDGGCRYLVPSTVWNLDACKQSFP